MNPKTESGSRKVQITETILRDAQQSLMATRLPYADYEDILSTMDKAGYYSIECWGGATFDSCLRYLNEDPWERLRNLRKNLPNTRLQMLLRGQNLLGYKHYHDDVVEKFIELSIKNGIDVIRIFDALNDFRNIETALASVKKYARERTVASGCISYTQSPVHTVQKYIEMCRELKKMGFDTICLKDMAGTMTPYEAEYLIKGIKDAIGDMTLILHTHSTTGMAYMTLTKAIESGIDVIDCATSCFSGGTSQPATETMYYALTQFGIETGLDEGIINKVNDFFKPVKQKYVDNGQINAKSLATDSQALVYKVPGGMLSNMIANLTDMHAMDKFDAALAEIPKVREDMGYPPLVTPLSQMVGNQAVTNVLVGERYKNISKEIKNYIKGEYGIPPAPIAQELIDKVLGENKPVDCRDEDKKRTGEDFAAAKEALGDLCQSEEDVMSYICYPDQTLKFLKYRREQAERESVYTIEPMD
ncbi:MAG: pyruvate carboxylase subunit B [Ruminococcus sp.]|nr:pyruvate carboxylase subunit B [Ruminococcus sp.]